MASRPAAATDRIVADGHVYYVTPQQNARGDHAVYSQADDQIVITGDVVVVQGNDVARGDKLTLKVVDARRQDGVERHRAGPKPGRVRGVFYPNRDGANALDRPSREPRRERRRRRRVPPRRLAATAPIRG